MRERILLQLKRWGFPPLTLTVWILAALLIGFSGPFGSFTAHPLLTRILYWFVLIGLSIVVANGLRALFVALGAQPGTAPFMLGLPPAFGIIFAPIIVVIRSWLQPIEGGGGLLYLFGLCTLIFATMLMTRRMLGLDKPLKQEPPRLALRLQEHKNKDIARLSVDDHYVIVFFEDGTQERLLMRFSDAIAEMDTIEGLCVHRSHWVAQKMIEGLETTKGRDVLALTDGTRLPVGPKYRPRLDELDLF